MTPRRAFLPLLLCLSWLACTALPCRAEGTPPFFGLALDGPPTREAIDRAASSAGLTPQMIVFFTQWPAQPDTAPEGSFPVAALKAIDAWGAMPCLTFEPMFIDAAGREQPIAAARILGGEYDAWLTACARAARDFARPFVLRFAHEMNLKRYHWGTSEAAYGPDSPRLYREMFRHVRAVFRREGAGNALFAFCPNGESVPGPGNDPKAAWNTIAAWWPGADAVDVLGVDGYNWGTTRIPEKHGWRSSFRPFAEIVGPAVRELRGLAPDKPLVVFETASAAEGGDKAAWAADAVRVMRGWKVAGFAWFEADKEVDWRLRSGAPGADATLRKELSTVTSQLLVE